MPKPIPIAKLGAEINRTTNALLNASTEAINHTAFRCRKVAQSSLADTFTLRNSWTQRGILVAKATKQKPYAEVFSRDWYVAQREDGGERITPKKNTLGESALEIPTKSVFELIQQVTGRKIIPKKFHSRVQATHKPLESQSKRQSAVYLA